MQLPSWPTALPQTPDTHEAPRLQEMRKRHEHEIEQLRARHAREDQTLRIHLRMNSMNPTPPSSTTSSYSTPDTRKRSLERTLSTETTDASKKTKLAMSSAVQNSPICPTFPPSRPLGYSYQPPQTPHSWGRQPSHPPRPTQINSHPYRPILPKPQLPQALSSLSPLPSHSSTLPQINLSLTPPSVPVSETALSDACDQPDQDDDAPLPVVPRPSDMEIANLTLEQKRQVYSLCRVSHLQIHEYPP